MIVNKEAFMNCYRIKRGEKPELLFDGILLSESQGKISVKDGDTGDLFHEGSIGIARLYKTKGKKYILEEKHITPISVVAENETRIKNLIETYCPDVMFHNDDGSNTTEINVKDDGDAMWTETTEDYEIWNNITVFNSIQNLFFNELGFFPLNDGSIMNLDANVQVYIKDLLVKSAEKDNEVNEELLLCKKKGMFETTKKDNSFKWIE